MSSTTNREEYYREVFAYTQSIVAEDHTILGDLKATGIEADVRRAAIDGIINEFFDRPLKEMLNAMQMADIAAIQSARVIAILSTTFERRSKS